MKFDFGTNNVVFGFRFSDVNIGVYESTYAKYTIEKNSARHRVCVLLYFQTVGNRATHALFRKSNRPEQYIIRLLFLFDFSTRSIFFILIYVNNVLLKKKKCIRSRIVRRRRRRSWYTTQNAFHTYVIYYIINRKIVETRTIYKYVQVQMCY